MYESEEFQQSIKYMGMGIFMAKQILQEFGSKLEIDSSGISGTQLSFNLRVDVDAGSIWVCEIDLISDKKFTHLFFIFLKTLKTISSTLYDYLKFMSFIKVFILGLIIQSDALIMCH